jgi:hypothetical protein
MKIRRLSMVVGATTAALALSAAPAFAQDCFLTHASAKSHQGASTQWFVFPLAEALTAPPPDGPGLECEAQVNEVLARVEAAGLPTVFFIKATKVLPDAGGPGKGGIDHFEDSPLIGEIFQIAADVQGTVSCP